jgi:hypothetical protein
VELLLEVARAHRELAKKLAAGRPLLRHAASQDQSKVQTGLEDEERRFRAEDKAYWSALLSELERLRHPR